MGDEVAEQILSLLAPLFEFDKATDNCVCFTGVRRLTTNAASLIVPGGCKSDAHPVFEPTQLPSPNLPASKASKFIANMLKKICIESLHATPAYPAG